MEQAFQKEPLAQPQEPKALREENREDQRVQSGLDQREVRAKETHRGQYSTLHYAGGSTVCYAMQGQQRGAQERRREGGVERTWLRQSWIQ